MLLDSPAVGSQRGLDQVRRGLPPVAELRGCRRPRLAVAREAVGAQLGAERNQRGELGHGLHGPVLGHAHKPVRVEVVAEQERRVVVGGREQARAPVVEEVALVDRLEPERVPLLGEQREDRLVLALAVGAQRVRPEPALRRRGLRDRLPDVQRYSQPASSFVQ
jgi:hypothetical protein